MIPPQRYGYVLSRCFEDQARCLMRDEASATDVKKPAWCGL